MAKKDVQELLERWRKAEDRYRRAADDVLAGDAPLTKPVAIELAEARAKADKRMHDYLKVSLGGDA